MTDALSLAVGGRNSKDLPLMDGAGVYRLVNAKTRQVYVGSTVRLVRRYMYWRHAARRHGWWCASRKIEKFAKGTPPEDWMFEVMLRLDGVDEDEMARHEQQAIKKAINTNGGWRVLNTRIAAYRRPRKAAAP